MTTSAMFRQACIEEYARYIEASDKIAGKKVTDEDVANRHMNLTRAWAIEALWDRVFPDEARLLCTIYSDLTCGPRPVVYSIDWGEIQQ